MIVARHDQHPAMRRRTVGVAVLERVAGAVDARPSAANGAEACPAKWSAHGDATLKPGPELVGKVRQALANQGA